MPPIKSISKFHLLALSDQITQYFSQKNHWSKTNFLNTGILCQRWHFMNPLPPHFVNVNCEWSHMEHIVKFVSHNLFCVNIAFMMGTSFCVQHLFEKSSGHPDTVYSSCGPSSAFVAPFLFSWVPVYVGLERTLQLLDEWLNFG